MTKEADVSLYSDWLCAIIFEKPDTPQAWLFFLIARGNERKTIGKRAGSPALEGEKRL